MNKRRAGASVTVLNNRLYILGTISIVMIMSIHDVFELFQVVLMIILHWIQWNVSILIQIFGQ